MSGSSFRSVFMVASCAGAALGCYLVSLRVASERAALEDVESQIVMTQRDIRLLQTEIGTRGRLAQLERWNVKVLALSAPAADQFLEGGFALARLARPAPANRLEAPVVLASAPADGSKPTVQGVPQTRPGNGDEGVSARDLLHVASLKAPTRPAKAVTAEVTRKLSPSSKAPTERRPDTVQPRELASAEPLAKTPTTVKPGKSADPLAPLPATSKPITSTTKDTGKAR